MKNQYAQVAEQIDAVRTRLTGCSSQLEDLNVQLDMLCRAASYDCTQGMAGYYPEMIAQIRKRLNQVTDQVKLATNDLDLERPVSQMNRPKSSNKQGLKIVD